MIKIVEKFLEKFNLNSAEHTFLVGFSGGCDSLCLLDILLGLSLKYKFKLVAMHLNHNWRGEESLQEEKNCESFCKKNNIEFVSETLNEDGLKSEKVAREARYDFFARIAKKYSNSAIFTAHTRSDNAETLVYRIIKGTGIRGLQGILSERKLESGSVYRPLLSVSRSDIEGYCISRGLIANTDSSNSDINYKRNFIRHKIMPLAKEINYNAEKSIVSLAEIAINQNKIVEQYLGTIKEGLYFEDRILTQNFKKLTKEVRLKIVYDLVLQQSLDYDFKKIKNILKFIESNFNSKAGSRHSLANDLWLFANNKYIYVIDKLSDKKQIDVKITKEGEYKISESGWVFSIRKCTERGSVEFPSEKDFFAYVNLDDVGLNLELRTRREGDFIRPFGMDGTMKLKKYLNAKGVAQHEKDGIVLLCKNSEVLWVAGVGLSNKLKVVNKPTHVIELKKS